MKLDELKRLLPYIDSDDDGGESEDDYGVYFDGVLMPYDVGRLLESLPDLIAAVEVICAHAVIGGGYCVCSRDRDPDKADHQPECADIRDALKRLGVE